MQEWSIISIWMILRAIYHNNMSYALLSSGELQTVAPELGVNPRAIKNNGFWYVKYKKGTTDEEKRDLLAYLLGKDICNVAEVKLLSELEHIEVKTLLNLDIESNPQNTFLVRLGHSYRIDELPNKTLEKAVATELVYSIWVRRRDTHSKNRAYLEGIPIFFDHQTTFLGDPENAHSTLFFRNSPDHGHPASWRIKIIPSSEKMETIKARDVPENEKAWHYIYNQDKFLVEIKNAEELVRKLGETDLIPTISAAGFNEATTEAINNFLKNNLITLSSDIEQMKEIIFRP